MTPADPSEHEEIEFKVLLPDAAAAERLVEAARRRAPVRVETAAQTNHFFDTVSRDLRAARLALRLRESGGRWRLTLKGEGVEAAGDLPSARPEAEAEVDAAAARAAAGGDADPLALARGALGPDEALVAAVERATGGAPLAPAGSFTNERRRLGPLPCGAHAVTLELDRTTFPSGRVDHEVELEVPAAAVDDARTLLESLLAEADCPWRPSRSKAARLFELLDAAGGTDADTSG